MSLLRKVEINTTEGQVDAFGRWRMSEPQTIFDSKLLHGKDLLFFDENTAGAATISHSETDASVNLSVSSNGDRAIRQTFMRFNYQPGKSQLILQTGILGEPVANTHSRIGYFNTSSSAPYTASRDGIYFGQDGTDKYVAISKSGTETKVTQANWNIDKMDGSGESGLTLDFDSAQIFMIDFEWLGAGRVRMGFVIGGKLYYVHDFNHANNGLTGAYMSSPNHSIRYEAYSTGGSLTVKQICCSVISEGGSEVSGLSRSVNVGIGTQTISTTREGILGVRLKSTHLDASIAISLISIISTTNEDSRWELHLNPTITDSPTWNSAGTGSPAEYAIGSGSNTITSAGEILASGYGSSNLNLIEVNLNTLIRPGVSINGTRDQLWICISTLNGTGSFVGAMDFVEGHVG